MSATIVSAVVLTAAAVYWYVNGHKPLKHILSELKHTLDMQGAGAGGLIDDWVNIRRNKVVLPDAKRKVAVITGGARGIGTEVIRGLLKANMRVVMGIRNPDEVRHLSRTMENGDNLCSFKLDLKSLKSVKEFAQKVTETYPDIHILVNNAGIMFGNYEVTEDGFESQLAVNHLGHFYLTHLLLPTLKKSGAIEGPARIVNVSSCAHYPGKIYFEDINMKGHYDATAAYSQAKLAQLMSARYINKILEENNCPVKAFSVHPGIVDTDIFEKTLFKQLFPWAMKLFFKTPAKGAVSILHACFEESLDKKGGLYISNCIEGISSKFSKDADHQKKLFEISCELVGINQTSFGQ
ncbi:Short-chain dehydrogenase [Operophtera brumata]|uniref:Short-chain dehydrogenase n=1 Tax=Operophtera brumata TaxID=104452 RepID=A0A0L7KMP1_OPEBR|nr:Short-chain dehydrogenase [Operophtera brumata]